MSKIVYCWYCDIRLNFEGIKDDKIMLKCPSCYLRVYVKEEDNGKNNEENK